MLWDQNLIQLFQKGGFAMWPLLLCSILGAAIIAERSIYFFSLRLNYDKFRPQLMKLLSQKKWKEALRISKSHPNPVSKIVACYLQNLKNDDIRNEALKREGSLALEKVETRLRPLAALTHISPLLGLLGTVTGLVTAFHQIEILGGQANPGDLAAGIWEALITTVYGLVIAIPCMAAYHGFESEADRIARRMQFITLELDEFFGKNSTGDFKLENIELSQEKMGVTS